MTSETVRQAAALPDLNHRDPEFATLVGETKRRLLGVYPEMESGWVPYLLGGSGTAATEATVVSCIRTGPVLVIENGYYSGRIVDILSVYQIPHEVFRLDWSQSWTDAALTRLRSTLRSGCFEAVLATHNETTLGRLNPIVQIANLCRERSARLFVDAMSSFGADPLPLDGVDAVISSANKCLHGLPGVSFVLLRDAFAAEIRSYPRRSFYLSLPMYQGDDPPLTPPVPVLQSLRQALRENLGGQADRYEAYREKIGLVREGLGSMGFRFAVPEDKSSCTLASPSMPEGWTFKRWFDANYKRGFVLYGCKGDLRERYFQASVMGEVTPGQVQEWLACVRDLLKVGRRP